MTVIPPAGLTAAQRGIWFAQAAFPNSNAYQIAEYIDIDGPIDPAEFELALRQTVAEAEALHIHADKSEWCLCHRDFAMQAAPLAAALIWMQSDIAASGDLSGELFAFGLLRLAPTRWLYYQRYHHLLIDGFGMMLVARRVAALYSQARTPFVRPTRGSRIFGSHAAFTAAEARYSGSEDEAIDGRFWRDRLAGWSGPLLLANKTDPCSGQSYSRSLTIDATPLLTAASYHNVSFARLVVALQAIWMNAASGVTDLVLGLALISRQAGATPTPAMASNVLPLRLALQPDTTAIDLARQIGLQRYHARRHSRYRGERLAQELPRSQGGFGPVANVMSFNYDISFAGHRGCARVLSIGPVDDLCFTVCHRKDGSVPEFALHANPSRYSETQLADLSSSLEGVAKAIGRDPLGPLYRLALVGPEERTRLLAYNSVKRPLNFISLPAMFEARAAETPEADCLVAEGDTQCYAEVNGTANRLARYFLEFGVTRGDIVAILLPRGTAAITLVISVIKSGAAYLLIDPSLPIARVQDMLLVTQPKLVVTLNIHTQSLPDTTIPVYLDAPTLPGKVLGYADGNLTVAERKSEILADDAAYVIFTSGTTGRPKAIVVPHRGLVSLAATLAERLGVNKRARVLQFSALGFDALVFELLASLGSGGCLYLPHEDERHGLTLSRFLERHRITHALLPPAALAGLRPASQLHPHTLIVGGEACSQALATAWSRGRCMVNAYGPAESTVCAVISSQLTGTGTPPIGVPVINTAVYVLDTFRRLLPGGATGELYIAGDGLALGYLGRADLTAERFLPCLLAPEQNMYRTGDLVRWRPDGALEFVGRTDRQIKLRGIRIEPAEVERALCQLPGVQSAVVVLQAEQAFLVGYIVTSAGGSCEALDTEAMRTTLAAFLPTYMVPAAIIQLTTLPLTPNGKLDMAALPEPHFAVQTAAPRTSLEATLSALFAEVLTRASVGIEDSFFSLGGDSLKATLLTLRIHDALGFELSIATIFANPTVAALARHLETAGIASASPMAVMLPLHCGGSYPGLFCVHPGPGLGWPYAAFIRHFDADQPLYAVQARGLDGIEPLPTSLREMAADYAAEMRLIQPNGPYHLLGWSSGGPLAHAIATTLQEQGAEVGLLVSIDGYPAGPFYGENLPMGIDAVAERNGMRLSIQRYLAHAAPNLPLSTTVIDDWLLTAMIAVFTQTGKNLASHSLEVFSGNLLLFRSTEPYEDRVLPDAASWQPYVSGQVETVFVGCHHDAMLLPGPVDTIGPILAKRLVRWRRPDLKSSRDQQ